ncbi:MAG: tetratricopeptide repeat protein, partial [Terriglobia bacterium]
VEGYEARARRRPRYLAAGALVGLTALVAMVLALNVGGLRDRLLGRPPPGIGPGGRPAIAVMYFDYSGGAEEARWLSRGVPDMLRTGLAQTPGLDVVSSQRLHEVMRGELETIGKGQVLEVARRAGAGAVVVGSIFQAGSEVRIGVEVQDVGSGRILFAHSVRGEDVFSLADELIEQTRRGLNLAAAPATRPVAEVTTDSLEAYRLYTEGLEALRNVRYADARQLFQKAVELDPSFAMPYFQLSWIADRVREPALEKEYLLKTMEHLDRLPERQKLLVQAILARKVEQNPEKAISLLENVLARYPDEEDAYALLQRTYGRDLSQPQKALATAERGVKALPNSSFLRNDYGYALLYSGRYAEAVPQFEAYARLRPKEPNPHDSLGEAYLFTGQPEKALESYARAVEVDPSFWGSHQGRAGAYAMLGRYDAALSELDEAEKILVQADLPRTGNHLVKAHVLSRVGRYREAEEHLRQGLQSAESHKDSLFKTLVHLLVGWPALERQDYRGAGDSARRAREAAQQIPSAGRRDEWSLVADLLAGTAEARAGNLKAARAHLESIMKLQNPELELHRQYYHWLEGEIALAAGNLMAAEKAYAVAVPQRKPFWLNVCASSALHRDGLARVKRARGDLRGAIAAYRDLLTPDIASKWIGMLEPRYVLELARLLADTGDKEAARKEYQRFLDLWKNADPGLPELAQAKSEYAKLQ